jgi:ribonuclease HII
MQRAVEALDGVPEHLLLDARTLRALSIPQQRIIKGDQRSLSIAAASILAKTARDARMRELDVEYPGYGFAKHKGYPVREHLRALERLGASPVHRRSFAPVRHVLALPPLPPWPIRSEPMAKEKVRGRAAEGPSAAGTVRKADDDPLVERRARAHGRFGKRPPL